MAPAGQPCWQAVWILAVRDGAPGDARVDALALDALHAVGALLHHPALRTVTLGLACIFCTGATSA